MSKDEEKDIHETLRVIVKEEVGPIIRMVKWILALFSSFIFGGIIFIVTISVRQSQCITSEETYNNFLLKSDYHQYQKDEHISDIEAIHNPDRASDIYMRQDARESEKIESSHKK